MGEPFPDLLSVSPGSYGGSFAHYTFLCLALAAVAGFALLRGRKGGPGFAALAAAGAAPAAAYLLLLLLAPALNGYGASLRYAIPFLLAGAPAVIQLFYMRGGMDAGSGISKYYRLIPLLAAALVIISFSWVLLARVRQGLSYGSVLAFSSLVSKPEYLAYNEDVLHGDTGARIRKAQTCVPAGAALVAWVYAPFHLDYRRNPVYDAEPAGIASPWAVMPDAQYFMVEYHGLAVRPPEYYEKCAQYFSGNERRIALKCMTFMQTLMGLRRDSEVLYNDGRISVFRKNEAPR
jgi:hypothetical protein